MKELDIYYLQSMGIDVWLPRSVPGSVCTHNSCMKLEKQAAECYVVVCVNHTALSAYNKNRFILCLSHLFKEKFQTSVVILSEKESQENPTICVKYLEEFLRNEIPILLVCMDMGKNEFLEQYTSLNTDHYKNLKIVEYQKMLENCQSKKEMMIQVWPLMHSS